MNWIIKRDGTNRYFGAYEWEHSLAKAVRFPSRATAKMIATHAAKENSGVHVVRVRTRGDRVHEDVRRAWGLALDRAKTAEDQRDEWARQCNMASEAQAEAVSTASRLARRVAELEAVLSRIARQGPHYGVDDHPWQHWSTIAEKALSVPSPSGEPK